MLRFMFLLQLAGRTAAWPRATPRTKHGLPNKAKASWSRLGRSTGLDVLQCVRQSKTEFSYECVPQLIDPMHAFCIAVSVFSRKMSWHHWPS